MRPWPIAWDADAVYGEPRLEPREPNRVVAIAVLIAMAGAFIAIVALGTVRQRCDVGPHSKRVPQGVVQDTTVVASERVIIDIDGQLWTNIVSPAPLTPPTGSPVTGTITRLGPDAALFRAEGNPDLPLRTTRLGCK